MELYVYGPEGASSKLAVGAFVFHAADGTEHQFGESTEWSELVPVFALRRDRVASATIARDGDLQITFARGAVIEAGPHEDYESWEVVGPGRLLSVCPPGGGEPAIWM